MQNADLEHLAGRIADLIKAEAKTADLSSIQASIAAINARLDGLESSSLSSPVSTVTAVHPSAERFAVAEALADEIFTGIHKEKACTFEPNGKPCDHCSMCSSRGF